MAGCEKDHNHYNDKDYDKDEEEKPFQRFPLFLAWNRLHVSEKKDRNYCIFQAASGPTSYLGSS